MKTKSRSILAAATLGIALTPAAFALNPFRDSFNGSRLNKARWVQENGGRGKLAQSSKKLNFTVSAPPTGDDYSILELRGNRPGFSESWQVIVDVRNSAGQGESVGVGIGVFNAADPNDSVNLEFYGSGSRGGFNFIGITDDRDDPTQDVRVNPGSTKGSLRIGFSKDTRLFTFWYDPNGSSDGYQWTELCTFSPTGSGGTRNGNWRMDERSGSFGVMIFGYGERKVVDRNRVQLDNFALKPLR